MAAAACTSRTSPLPFRRAPRPSLSSQPALRVAQRLTPTQRFTPIRRRVRAARSFDQTLASANVSPWIDRGSMVRLGFGGPARVAMLAELLGTLHAHGVALAICSLNSRDVIHCALDATGLLRFFGAPPVICDAEDFSQCGRLKSAVIAHRIMPRVGVEDEAGVLFVDDDPANVRDLVTRLSRASALLVPRNTATLAQAVAGRSAEAARSGMGAPQCQAVLEWAFDGAPPPKPPVAPAAAAASPGTCLGFTPKRSAGPLARRCATCGGHEHAHARCTAQPA